MHEEKHIEIVIPANHERVRLDKYLVQQVGSLSRARLQRLIAAGLIHVDGEAVKASHLVSPGETISVLVPKPEKVDILPEQIPLNILHEDDALIVLNKPAGMVVHPAFSNYTGTLVNALLHHCGELSSVGGRQRPGIVHRLDKDTSGVMVVAKNDHAHGHLSQQFREKTTERIYHAICWGRFRKRSGRIETFLARSPKDRRRMSVRPQGKSAVTHYQAIETFGLHSLVQLRLETGRTHQIRVHMAYMGHPVFGDGEYGGRNRQLGALSTKQRLFASELLELMPRQSLHAKTLGFVHPTTNEFLQFETDLPEDMQRLLDRLRQHG